YRKKARGTLTAECRCAPPAVTAETDYSVTATIADGSGDLVATATVLWRLAPASTGSADAPTPSQS
ncbi:MAG TPA: DUF4442 domain-containing protein, partial [Gemmatimonadaceae bacterium]|nr:DUF4442 domain-containing protein [Gemmatimonadaceae bacterium]